VARLVQISEKPDMSVMPMPPSELMSRVRDFLPQMEAANAKLALEMQSQPADKFDVEVLGERDAQHVEMDIACGVLDLKDDAALEAAEAAIAGVRHSQLDSSSVEDSSSDDDSDAEQIAGKNQLKPSSANKSHGITILD